MFSRPQVSIIIPVYNMQDELPKCLESVVCQTFTDYEVLVINDGSTDNTAQIIQNFKEQHPHLCALRNPIKGWRRRVMPGFCAQRERMFAFWTETIF